MFRAQCRPVEIDGQVVELVVCPLCFAIFDEVGVAAGLMTDEEAPAKHEWKKLGRKGKTHRCLTCETCNNGAGGTYESAHAHYLERGGVAGVTRETHTRLPDMCGTHASEYVAAQYNFLVGGEVAQRRTELKSGLIIAFAALGYRYVLDSNLDPIREMVAPGSEVELPRNTCLNGSLLFLEGKIIAIEDPFKCLLVTHPTLHKYPEPELTSGVHAILLPRPGGPPPSELYPAMAETVGTSTRFNWLNLETRSWSKTGYPDFHWDVCGNSEHPRSDRQLAFQQVSVEEPPQ